MRVYRFLLRCLYLPALFACVGDPAGIPWLPVTAMATKCPVMAMATALVMATALAGNGDGDGDPRLGCNGQVELCDRAYDQVVFAGTHNSHAAISES